MYVNISYMEHLGMDKNPVNIQKAMEAMALKYIIDIFKQIVDKHGIFNGYHMYTFTMFMHIIAPMKTEVSRWGPRSCLSAMVPCISWSLGCCVVEMGKMAEFKTVIYLLL